MEHQWERKEKRRKGGRKKLCEGEDGLKVGKR